MFAISHLKLLRKGVCKNTMKGEKNVNFYLFTLMISDQNFNFFHHVSSKVGMVGFSNSGRLRDAHLYLGVGIVSNIYVVLF